MRNWKTKNPLCEEQVNGDSGCCSEPALCGGRRLDSVGQAARARDEFPHGNWCDEAGIHNKAGWTKGVGCAEEKERGWMKQVINVIYGTFFTLV